MARLTVLDRGLGPAATTLIQQFGRYIIVRRSARTPRPGSGDISASTASSQTILAYVPSLDTGFANSAGNIEDATLEAWTDFLSLSWIPDEGDEVVLGTDESSDQVFVVTAVSQIYSGERVAVVKFDFGL